MAALKLLYFGVNPRQRPKIELHCVPEIVHSLELSEYFLIANVCKTIG